MLGPERERNASSNRTKKDARKTYARKERERGSFVVLNRVAVGPGVGRWPAGGLLGLSLGLSSGCPLYCLN